MTIPAGPGSRPALSGRQRRHDTLGHQQHRAVTSLPPRAHRPARPALRGDGRQAEAARRGVAVGPRGPLAVPRAGASRPKARQLFVSSQFLWP